MSNNKIIKSITELNVFLSSPSNLQLENELFQDIITDTNAFLYKVSNIRLSGINWRSHTYPSSGNDAQDIINKQLPKYDIYVGCVSNFIGSPTTRSSSGTIEEYQNALLTKKKILFYFKSEKFDLSNTDLNELIKVKDFQLQLKKDGIFYWTYNNEYEFRRFLTFHLFNHAIEYSLSHSVPFNIQDLETSIILIKEGDMFGLIGSESILLFKEFLESTNNKLQKLTKSIETANKSQNKALIRTTLNNLYELFKQFSRYTKFYLDSAFIFMNFTLESYTKALFGLKELGLLGKVSNDLNELRNVLLQFRVAQQSFNTHFESLLFLDKSYSENVIQSCIVTVNSSIIKLDQSVQQIDILLLNITLLLSDAV